MRFSRISRSRRRLLSMLKTVGFGSVGPISLRNGDPQFTPLPLVKHRFSHGQVPVLPDPEGTDFVLKRHHIDLLHALDGAGDLDGVEIQVQDGLPVQVMYEMKVAV